MMAVNILVVIDVKEEQIFHQNPNNYQIYMIINIEESLVTALYLKMKQKEEQSVFQEY